MMQQNQIQTRKRQAPGTSLTQNQNLVAQRRAVGNANSSTDAGAISGNNAQNSDDQFMGWEDLRIFSGGDLSGNASNFAGATFGNSANTGALANSTNPPQSSNQLVRRNTNQQLTTRDAPDQWPEYDDGGQVTVWNRNTDESADLETRALAAKKDAQAKRKQIPPFVQKLSSFLDESKNTDLIRWSDDGNSFIVLDEDEFAKTLIPELFKHNNYASFVRQLNMYGFHKRVGLSDNSMKASENKRKTPSEYYNEFFKRGRPELLWLISKPKNAPTSGKRKKADKDDLDDDDDRAQDVEPVQSASSTSRGNLISLPKTELDSVRLELRQLQQQQRYISSVIAQVKKQNDQLYQQASAFQTLHDRHENSINAILTFLATFYSRSLEDRNTPNIQDMFTHAIPGNLNQQQGNVVDVGDFDDAQLRAATQPVRNARRPLALLPAPVGDGASATGRAATISPPSASANSSRAASAFRPPADALDGRARLAPARTQYSNGSSPVPKLESMTPENNFQVPDAGPNTPNTEQMMQVINAANSNSLDTPANPSAFDFPAALADYQTANGASPLTPQQKNDVLSMIARSQPGGAGGNDNNALVNPNGSSLPPLPNFDDFEESQQQLGYLQQLQDDNQRRVSELAERLVPLSPTGSIPGLHSDDITMLGQQMGAPDGASWNLDDLNSPSGYFGGNTGPTYNGDNLVTPFPGADLFDFDALSRDGPPPQGGRSDFDLFGDRVDEEQGLAGQAGGDAGPEPETEPHIGGRIESVASSENGTPRVAVNDAFDAVKSPIKRRRVG